MYSLSYEMMVQVLRQFGYSGEVQADVSSHSVLKRSGHVVLVVQEGNVITCTIFNQDGQKLYADAQALLMLSRLGVLDWRLVNTAPPGVTRSPSSSLAGEPPGRSASFYPCRLAVPQSQMRSWPMLYRTIYSLADGTRSIQQIAMLLSHPPPKIEQAVQHLQAIGGIAGPK